MNDSTTVPPDVENARLPESPLLSKVARMIQGMALKTTIDEKSPPPKLKGETDPTYVDRIKSMARKAMGYDTFDYLLGQLQVVIDREAGEAAILSRTRKRQTLPYEAHPGEHRTHRSKFDLLVKLVLGILILVLFGGTITTMGGVFEKGGLGSNLLLASLAAIPFAAGLMIPKVVGAIAPSRDTKHTVLMWLTGLSALVFVGTVGLYPFAFADAITSAASGVVGSGSVFGDLSGEVAEEPAPTEVFKIAFIASLIALDTLIGGVVALFIECKVADRRHRDVDTPAEGAFLIEKEGEHNTNGEHFVAAKSDVMQVLSEIEAEAERVAGVCLDHELKRAKKVAAVAAAAELGLTLRSPDDDDRNFPLFQSA